MKFQPRAAIPAVILTALVLQGCAHGPSPSVSPAVRPASEITAEAAEYTPAPAAVDKLLRAKLEGRYCGGDYPYSVLLSEVILVRRSTAATKPNLFYFKCGYAEIYGEASVVRYIAKGKVDMGTRQVELTDLDDDESTLDAGRRPMSCGLPGADRALGAAASENQRTSSAGNNRHEAK